jgi:hypothetical protein
MISTFCPGCTWALSRRPCRAGKPETATTAACSKVRLAGLGASLLSGARAKLGVRAFPDAEHLFAGLKPGHVVADGGHHAGQIRAQNGGLGRPESVARETYRVRQAGHHMPDATIHAGRVNAYQHLVVSDLRLVDVPKLQAVG